LLAGVKPEFKYGLLSGAGVCVWIALEYALGLHTEHARLGEITGLLSNLIPLTMLFLLLKAKRAGIYDGHLSLGAGIGAALLASFVASLLVYSGLTSYTHFINPTWVDQALELKVAAWRAQSVAETEIQTKIVQFRNAYTPRGLLLTTIVGMTLLGGLAAIPLTLLVRSLPRSAGA
jgi:hypothetical protein